MRGFMPGMVGFRYPGKLLRDFALIFLSRNRNTDIALSLCPVRGFLVSWLGSWDIRVITSEFLWVEREWVSDRVGGGSTHLGVSSLTWPWAGSFFGAGPFFFALSPSKFQPPPFGLEK